MNSIKGKKLPALSIDDEHILDAHIGWIRLSVKIEDERADATTKTRLDWEQEDSDAKMSFVLDGDNRDPYVINEILISFKERAIEQVRIHFYDSELARNAAIKTLERGELEATNAELVKALEELLGEITEMAELGECDSSWCADGKDAARKALASARSE